MQKSDKDKERGFASSSDPSEEVCNGVLSKKAWEDECLKGEQAVRATKNESQA